MLFLHVSRSGHRPVSRVKDPCPPLLACPPPPAAEQPQDSSAAAPRRPQHSASSLYSRHIARVLRSAHTMATYSTGFWMTLTTLAVTVAVATAAAVAVVDPSTDDVVVYDQRQNGTENVRISLSDLKVVLAPADGLFQIMSMAGAQFLNSELSHSSSEHRPTTGAECTGFKCNNRHRQAAKK